MSTFEEEKSELVNEAEGIIKNLNEKPDYFELLRAYNRLYTKAIAFVGTHATERKREFEQIHENNQLNLSSERPDITRFKANFYKQLGTIEGTTDHYPKTFVS